MKTTPLNGLHLFAVSAGNQQLWITTRRHSRRINARAFLSASSNEMSDARDNQITKIKYRGTLDA